MTVHSFNKWSWDDKINNALIEEIVACVQGNYRWNGDGTYCPNAFAILSTVDQMVFNIGKLIDESTGPLDENYVQARLPAFDYRDKAIQVILKTWERMGLLGKVMKHNE
jgi:hypothetical protein